MDLDPNDAELRYKYAMTLTDSAAQIMVLTQVLTLNPRYARAHFALGMLLVSTGKSEEGIKELQSAVELAPPEEAEAYTRRLVYILNDKGRADEAQRMQEELRKRTSHEH